MVRFRTATASLLLAGLVLLSACGRGTSTPDPAGNDAPPASDPPPAAAGTPYTIDKEKSTASYKAGEKLAELNLPTVAVGTTSAIEGALRLGDDGAILPALVKVDVRTLKSGEERRDMRVNSALKGPDHPYAEFAIGAQNPAVVVPTDGKEVAFKLSGTMKLAGVEKPVEWDAKARRDGDVLYLTAAVRVNMTDFQIKAPNVLGFVTVNEEVDLEVNLTARKG